MVQRRVADVVLWLQIGTLVDEEHDRFEVGVPRRSVQGRGSKARPRLDAGTFQA